MSSHRAPEPRFRKAAIVVFAVALGVVAGAGSVSAATSAATSTTATLNCPGTAPVTLSNTSATVNVNCSIKVPLPPPSTVAGPTVTAPGPTVTITASPSSSTPVTASPSPTDSATSTPPPGPANFPDASSTGPTGTLTPYAGGQLISADLSGADITGSVELAAGVTLSNSRIRCENETSWCVTMGAGSTLTHDEVGGGANGTTNTGAIGIWAGSGGKTNLIDHVDVHNTSDGLRIDGNTTIRYSYIHDLVIAGHSDGAQITQGSGPILFDHDAITGGTNCAVFDNRNDGTSTSTLTVQNSLLVADQTGSNQSSYGVFDNRTATATIIGDVFSRGWQVAPISISAGTATSNTYTDGASVS